jgi:hypothetical protein
MSVRDLHRRLRLANRRLCGRAREQFSALVSSPASMSAVDPQEIARLFRLVTDLELELGTPPEASLVRLPPAFTTDAFRAALRKLFEEREQSRGRRSSPRQSPCG